MIDFIFTLDYEIYGNGTGALGDLVYEPAERLREIFRKHKSRFVNFVEVAEFEKIDQERSDPAIDLVKRQIRDLHREGFETALHLHPQWYHSRLENGRWILDYNEYNLCTLPRTRIAEIVDNGLQYLRHLVGASDFAPISFRAGNWLFQPTKDAASVLAEHGFKIDSSVFKGGVQHNHGLDYRPARRNGRFWSFGDNVNQADSDGSWIEVPIHSEMVFTWKMSTSKRVSMGAGLGGGSKSLRQKLDRLRDFARLRYPLKLDFCRMTMTELTAMMEAVIREDRQTPNEYWPVVAIGHTKDLTDPATVDEFLSYLSANKITVSTFEDAYPRLLRAMGRPAPLASMKVSQSA